MSFCYLDSGVFLSYLVKKWKTMIALMWFRKDLRVVDNPALYAAAETEFIPIFIHDPAEKQGKISIVRLHESLEVLNQRLQGKLSVYYGRPLDILHKIIKDFNIDKIFFNNCYEPWRSDAEIKAVLEAQGIHVKTFNASLLTEPNQILKADGSPYSVYTPYKNAVLKFGNYRKVLQKPTMNLISASMDSASKDITQHIGEEAAMAQLTKFIETKLTSYKVRRNFPAENHTSNLSANLHFGEISPNQILEKVALSTAPREDIDHFISELIWREFGYYLLFHHPNLQTDNFNRKFDHFPWRDVPEDFIKWTQGMTGCPIVDAGMRQLLQTGYMHNRVRLLTASFLVKDLMINWRQGESWFWEHLVDADLANNNTNWQWVAGCGVDSAPYFRIFSMSVQAQKFDPDGAYIKTYLPELKNIPAKHLFEPNAETWIKYGVKIGVDYPAAIADQDARARFLAAHRAL